MQPGVQAPPMVCLQFCFDGSSPELIHVKDPACKASIVNALESSLTLTAHNTAYDAAVICAQWPDLIPLVFDAYAGNRVTCTQTRQKLIDLSLGEFDVTEREWTSLAGSLQRVCGYTLDKTDPWRTKYGTLYHIPVESWPHEAVRYALADAIAERDLFQGQEAAQKVLGDQFRQSRYAFWLRLMECRGIRTERAAVERFHRQVLADVERDKQVCLAAGIVRPDGTKNTKAAMQRMVQCMTALGEDPPLTDKGQELLETAKKESIPDVSPAWVWSTYNKGISLDEDSCLASGDDTLLSYQRYGSLSAIMTRTERLYYGIDQPLQAQFQPLVETGRTSCRMGEIKPDVPPTAYGFQLHNLPRKSVDPVTKKARPGLRECFVPREGFLFANADYPGLELRTWSQVCLWSVGQSRMADILNTPDLDVHTELAASIARIPTAEAYARVKGELGKEAQTKFKDDERQVAKIANFGYQGGMGPKTLRVQARKEYRVFLELEQCYALRESWKQTWPEAQAYLNWVNTLLQGHGDRARSTVVHFLSERYRGHIPYTVTANTFFQGLAADAAKSAGFAIAHECYAVPSSPLYGCRIINFVHDEFILEVHAHPERAHLAAYRLRDLMASAAQAWLPDVSIGQLEPVLMRRWSKSAKMAHRDGMLIPWEDAA